MLYSHKKLQQNQSSFLTINQQAKCTGRAGDFESYAALAKHGRMYTPRRAAYPGGSSGMDLLRRAKPLIRYVAGQDVEFC